MLEVFAQLVAICAISAHLPSVLTAFIDNTVGQAALTKGYGMIWQRPGDEWHAGIMVDCRRVPSKAKVVDAVSRDDFARARREGWRVWTPASEIMHILAKSVDDLPTLWTKRRSTWCPVLPPRLLSRRLVGLGAPGGAEMCTRRRLQAHAALHIHTTKKRVVLIWRQSRECGDCCVAHLCAQ